MIVPERITVRVVTEDAADVSGILVQLTVKAGRKNPYDIFFPKTDDAGVATLTRDDFIGQFRDHWEAALMDHDGTPEDADPVVVVSLYDPSWAIEDRPGALAWPLLRHERTKWSSRAEEYESRITCRNGEFTAKPITVDLHQTHDFAFVVARK